VISAAAQDQPRYGQEAKDFNPFAGQHILLVEEDVPLANFLSEELRAEFFNVDSVHDGEAALKALEEGQRYDLMILGLNLPKLDGLTLLQQVRLSKPRLPMIVLSIRSTVEDKVAALEKGASDFMVKPFSFLELVARVRARLRDNSVPIENASRVGDLTLHREERRVERNGRRIDLTPREFAMLEYLMRHVGRPVSRSKLFEAVWNMPHDPSTNIVDVYMKYVRDKVDLPGERKLTHTVRGIGYLLRDEER
jgi:DNA-binding response OmpR family regulator